MIPLKDNIRSKSFPLVTITLIIFNVLIYIYQSTLTTENLHFLVTSLGFIPQRIVLEEIINNSSIYPLITFLTSAFLHGNFIHLASNMLYLWIFGDNIEDKLGKFWFIVFYLLAAIIGNIAHLMSEPTSALPAIGASGAVAGVLGAYFIYYPYSKVLTLVPIGIFFTIFHIPAVIFLGVWILLQSINAIAPLAGEAVSIAWWAHIGGFLLGVVYAIGNR
ncbi:rhomboid family intramembrane serine protease [Natranaerobius trueperi]|uniref:Rhomboid family intramembrane serine protease n=1 Tax=Natranaerobius trueperi TaxID=759412 RepID=A0A226BXW1_9FIRM|nr:rhomboid family intramembrane serine protease [Natranaerobius trueperi]OWZ83039.1 rhomboid family intramembrane serine protease [Natranaerobius trueperi]